MYIKLVEVLAQMALSYHDGKPVPFSLTVVSADRKRDRGGQLITYPNAVLGNFKRKSMPRIRQEATKAQNHFLRQTRNIVLPNGETRKIHIRLIVYFNNKTVVW